MKSFNTFVEEKDQDGNPCWKGYKMVGTKKKNGKEVPNCVEEECGAGEEGTKKLVKKYKKDTPMAEGKIVRNMRVQHVHNGNKGTAVKGSDRASGKVEVEWDSGQTTVTNGKFLKAIKEEAVPAAANAVAHGGVDMNPNGRPKRDRRKKWDFARIYRRARGLK